MRHYNVEKNDIYWTEEDIYCRLDEDYMSLVGFLAYKTIDNNNEEDQWYVAVERKMAELLDILSKRPNDEEVSDSASIDR